MNQDVTNRQAPFPEGSELGNGIQSPGAKRAWLARNLWLPIIALLLLLLMAAFTPPIDTSPDADFPIEVFAHDLSHALNSIWVGLSLMVLVLPSLWAMQRHRESPVWAWHALDAVFLDFLFVDALGKNVLTGLSRPNLHPSAAHPLRAGFPSGHATMAFLLAWLVWRRYPKLGPLWYLCAVLISWSRLEVHAHYPYQVYSSVVLGTALGALIISRQTGILFPRVFWSDEQLQRFTGHGVQKAES